MNAVPTYSFLLRVPFWYEPTRTQVSNLSRFLAKVTNSAVTSRVREYPAQYSEDMTAYEVTFTFHCTRVQAARTLVPSRYPHQTETVLFLTQDSDGTFLKTPCPIAQCFDMSEFTTYDWPTHYIPATAKVAS